jgi:hypothetical protein
MMGVMSIIGATPPYPHSDGDIHSCIALEKSHQNRAPIVASQPYLHVSWRRHKHWKIWLVPWNPALCLVKCSFRTSAYPLTKRIGCFLYFRPTAPSSFSFYSSVGRSLVLFFLIRVFENFVRLSSNKGEGHESFINVIVA